MRNAFLVALREYVENAKTKGFWIGIFMLPIVLFLSVQIPMLLEKKGTPVRYFVLLDYSGEFERQVEQPLEQQYQRRMLAYLNEYARQNGVNLPEVLKPFARQDAEAVDKFVARGGKSFFLEVLKPLLPADAPPFVEPERLFQRVVLPFERPATPADAMLKLRPALSGRESWPHGNSEVQLDAAVIIPAEIENQTSRAATTAMTNVGIQYWSRNLADASLRTYIEAAINQEIRRREYIRRGLDPAVFAEVERTRVPIIELNPKKEAGQERVSKAETLAQWAPVGFVYLLWVALFSISQMLLTNTIEEKSNRIIEVLLSSVTPAEFVLGKLAGIAAVGLTMVTAWIGSLILVLTLKSGGQSEVSSQMLAMIQGSPLILAFVVYFIFGYLLYAGIILGIGSVCNTLKEAQNYMGVITMLMMVPLLTMMFIPKDPNGTVATVLSWIPIYTPFIMMNRAAADPPMFDVIGTMLLLIVFTAFVLWGAVKIFRIGILRSGQPPRIVEIFRWLRSG
jgi:ABC-2 type transport system permease protein